ncbi:MAG: hypothetical protein ABJN62_11305 [Halioglobus sp.]
MKQDHIEGARLLWKRWHQLSKADVIESRSDAALLCLLSDTSVSVGLTIYEAGVRDRQALMDALVYYRENHTEQKGRSETPQAWFFRQLTKWTGNELNPSKVGRGDVQGNSGRLLDDLDIILPPDTQQKISGSIYAERSDGLYRFWWAGEEPPAQWIHRDYLAQTAVTKAIKKFEKLVEEAQEWL